MADFSRLHKQALTIVCISVLTLPFVTSAQISDIDNTDTEEVSSTTSVTQAVAVNTPQIKRYDTANQEVFGDFVVGPGKFELELEPGQSQTVMLTVTNRMGSLKTFQFEFEDTAGDATGDKAVMLLGEQEGPYTLRDYISVPSMEFDLEHAERAEVPVTVTLPPDIEPGGHYGSVVVSTVTQSREDSGLSGAAPATPIISRIGTLFFITAPGEQVRSGELLEFSTRNKQSWFSAGPVNFNIVFENTGSLHTNPYGELRIKNILGEEVGYTELEPWFVMPQSVRTREVTWDRGLLFGRYTATAFVNRGYEDIVDEKTVTFYVIPTMALISVFAVVFITFLLFKFIFSRFEFKRKS